MSTRSNLLCAALLALFPLPLTAQERATATATTTVTLGVAKRTAKAEPFVLEAGDYDIKQLTETAGTYLGINILVDPNECTSGGQIKLARRIETDRDGCEEVVTGLLYRSGFALLPLDKKHDLWEVIMMNGTRGREVFGRSERKTAEQVLARPQLYVPVITTVPLQHINAQLANNALRPFFASSGHQGHASLMIGNIGNKANLILAGMQPQVAQALRLIQECDQPNGLDAHEMTLEQRIQHLERRVAELEQARGAATNKKD